MRRLMTACLVMCAVACAPKPRGTSGAGTATGADPAPDVPPVTALMHGLWSGTASRSPLGRQPYAVVFRKDGAGLVAETPPTLGEEVLPPGAYQRFEFPEGAGGTTGSFRTSMGTAGLLEGPLTLDETRSSPTKRIFCEAGNCQSMELRWESLAKDKMSFQVWIDGDLHVDIGLTFDGDF